MTKSTLFRAQKLKAKIEVIGDKIWFSATYKSKPHGETNGTIIAKFFIDCNEEVAL